MKRTPPVITRTSSEAEINLCASIFPAFRRELKKSRRPLFTVVATQARKPVLHT